MGESQCKMATIYFFMTWDNTRAKQKGSKQISELGT